MKFNCSECGGVPELTDGREIYPHRGDLHRKKFWICRPCDAYVGCHGMSDNPLGSPAGCETRRLRSAAHAAFDPIWKTGRMSRRGAYAWLAKKLEIETGKCHISQMDARLARLAVGVSRELLARIVG